MNDLAWPTWAQQLATGIVLVDARLRLRWLNPALVEGLELGVRHPLGQPLTLLFADGDEAVARAARVLAAQRPAQWRAVPLAAANGREIRADIALQPFDDGLLLEVHVLAEPLSASSPLSATLRGFAHEADRLGTLANRLLHHDGAARLGPVNIHQLLERLADLLQAEPAPPQWRHDYDPSVPDLLGDADRLHQLLLNLARNAQEAGARTLTLRTRVEHGVRLGERMLRTALRLELIDDGAGIPAALRDTLFEPLVSGRADGTGLGLALSREIAREHGGELRGASRPGETVFTLYLPLERA